MKYTLTGLVFLLILFSSCVFSPDKESFTEIDRYAAPPVITNQTLDFNADTLYVWKPTQFNFDFKSNKQKIRLVVVHFADNELIFPWPTGSIVINPLTVTAGIHQLKIKVIAESGTGSIADKVEAENYEFKKSWVLVVEPAGIPQINISSAIVNGFLKFTWNKLDKPYISSYNYQIINEGLSKSYANGFTDGNITSFIDSLYVGGKITFSLSVNYEDVNGNYQTLAKSYVYNYPLTMSIKENVENTIISWTKIPFQCTTYFSFDDGPLHELSSDTTYSVPALGLGNEKRYQISFKPLKNPSPSYLMYNMYLDHTLGSKDGIPHQNVEYNPPTDTYFFKDAGSIKSANKQFGLTASYIFPWDISSDYIMAISKDKQTVSTILNGNLITLNASELALVSSKKLSFLSEEIWKISMLQYLDDQTMIMGYNLYGQYRFVLFNPGTGTVINESVKMPVEHNEYPNHSMDVSADGKHAAFCSQNGIYVFEIQDNQQLKLLYHDTQKYFTCFFDPLYPERLIVNRPADFQVFNCQTLKVGQTKNLQDAHPLNIDPQTHYMLLASNAGNKIYVYDYDKDLIKLTLNHHAPITDFKLINNTIFVNAGYHYDISSYVD